MASDATTGAIIGKNDQFVTTRNGTPRRINQNGQNGSVGLARMVRLLPTPNAREADKYSKKYNPNSQMGTALTAMAVNGMLPTPAARDYQPSVSPQALKRKNGKMRTDALCNLPVMLGEHHSQNGGKTSQLNPLFVAEMMGFPPDWTVLPTDTLIKNTTMKKIMFNDKFGLTQAVLEGRKTMTRRIIKCPRTFRGEWVAGFNIHRRHSDKKIVDWPCMYDADEREFDMGEILPKYELGEVVAIAQSYMDVDRFHRKGKNAAYLEYLDSILPELKLHPGWTNKMFVKADLMPRHIEFTDRKVERLQDISDEDCLKEGIYEDSGDDEFPPSIFYEFEGNKDNGFDTPREAFAALIDKVSGKGTWESNPYVWAYEFELMK